jgi:hypothetical protein
MLLGPVQIDDVIRFVAVIVGHPKSDDNKNKENKGKDNQENGKNRKAAGKQEIQGQGKNGGQDDSDNEVSPGSLFWRWGQQIFSARLALFSLAGIFMLAFLALDESLTGDEF